MELEKPSKTLKLLCKKNIRHSSVSASQCQNMKCNTPSFQRLRIQENVLLTASKTALSIVNDQELKNVISEITRKRNKDFETLKDTYGLTKAAIAMVAYNISSPEKIKKLDLVQYKRNILDLDDRINTFRKKMAKELTALKHMETVLAKDVSESGKRIEQSDYKLHIEPFPNIIPSKVKLICSPTQNTSNVCEEVQIFQKFLTETGGHQGGWGEQEHSLFLKFHRKLWPPSSNKRSAKANDALLQLSNALQERLPDLTVDDVRKHVSWYGEYRKLKSEQHTALQRWRKSRDSVKWDSYSSAADADRLTQEDIALQTSIDHDDKETCVDELTSRVGDDPAGDDMRRLTESKKLQFEAYRLERDILELKDREQKSADAKKKLQEYRIRDLEFAKRKTSRTSVKSGTLTLTSRAVAQHGYARADTEGVRASKHCFRKSSRELSGVARGLEKVSSSAVDCLPKIKDCRLNIPMGNAPKISETKIHSQKS